METLHRAIGLDARSVRRDFPILTRTINGRPLVYLDSAATSQKPRQVIDALSHYYETSNANVHRGAHMLGDEATAAYETARSLVAGFVGASDPAEVIFTRNATEAINLVARAWAEVSLRPGDEIITTEMEHHSNFLPWQMAARATGASLRVVPFDVDSGQIDLEVLEAMLGPRTRLVALTHVSNVLGTITPVSRIAELAHAHGALVLVDGAQSVPHLPIDVGSLGADFLAFSGHKMLGPMGIGALWARRSVLEPMPPFLVGGSMVRDVFLDRATWADLPQRFEAGTPSVADAVGLGAAVTYLDALGMDAVREHEVSLTSYALERLESVVRAQVYGAHDAATRAGVISFNLFDRAGRLIHPHDVSTVLDTTGVAVRAGHHCCKPLTRRLGVPATVRASFHVYSVPEDVDALVDGLRGCLDLFSD